MNTQGIRRTIATFTVLLLSAGSAWASDQEWWDAARKASCPELVDAYKTTKEAERKVVAAIKSSKDGTVATNVLGVTTLAVFGVGFFSWNDNASAEDNLADLRNDLRIVTTVAAEKKCALPGGV